MFFKILLLLYHKGNRHLTYTFNSTNGGHNGSINVLVSLDDGLLASGSNDATIKIWNLTERKLIFTFNSTKEGHTKKVTLLASLSQRRLVSGSFQEKYVKIWDLNTNRLANDYGHSVNLKTLIVLKNDNLIASGSSKEIIIWNGKTKKIHFNTNSTKEFNRDASTLHLAFINQTLLASAVDDEIKLWDLSRGKLQSTFHFTKFIRSLISFNQNDLAFGLNDGKIVIFDFVNNTQIEYKKHSKVVRYLIKTSDDFIISGSDDQTIVVKNIYRNHEKVSFNSQNGGHTNSITSLVLINKNLLASCSDDKSIKIWDLSTRKIKFTFDFENENGHTNKVIALAWSKQNNVLASGSMDMQIKIWKNLV